MLSFYNHLHCKQTIILIIFYSYLYLFFNLFLIFSFLSWFLSCLLSCLPLVFLLVFLFVFLLVFFFFYFFFSCGCWTLNNGSKAKTKTINKLIKINISFVFYLLGAVAVEHLNGGRLSPIYIYIRRGEGDEEGDDRWKEKMGGSLGARPRTQRLKIEKNKIKLYIKLLIIIFLDGCNVGFSSTPRPNKVFYFYFFVRPPFRVQQHPTAK